MILLRPRWHKVIADLWSSKLRSLLVVASITVGLFAVGMITSMQVIITEDMQAGYSSVNPSNIQVSVDAFDQEIVDHVRNLPGVAQAEGLRLLSLRVRGADGEWKPISVRAIAEIDETQINQVALQAGVWPPEDRQIVIDRYKLGDLGVSVGDELEIELPSGGSRKVKLVGVVQDQTIGAFDPGGFFISPIQSYTTLETLEWLEYPAAMNTLNVTVTGDPEDTERMRVIANQISEEIESVGPTVSSASVRASDDHPNRVYIQALSAVLFLLGFLVVFLSGFLITNTLSALLNQQVHMIGVMKTIGARQAQVMGVYMLLIFIYGVVAFLIALPLSTRIAYFLLEYLTSPINMVLRGYRIVPPAIILQLIIALVVPQAAGFLPILHGTRVPAVDALSGYSQANPPSAKGWINRQLAKLRGLSRPMLLSLRNTFRRRGRLFLTLFTLTLGGAIFIATFNVQSSLTNYIARIGRYFMADINVNLRGMYRIAEIEDLLLTVPGVTAVEGWAGADTELIMPDGSTGESISLIAPPANSKLIEPVMIEGRWVIPGDQNAVVANELFREAFSDLRVGDTVRLNIAGDEHDLVVVGFFQLAGKSGGYLGYTTYEYLSKVTGQANRAASFRVTADRPDLTLVEQEALGRQIEARLAERGIEVSSIEAGRNLTSQTADGLNMLTVFLLLMASLIAIVGSIGLAGTMSMNVLERTREIGIIRAIGASDRAVINLVIVEGMLIGSMSWLLGTLLSIPISNLLSNAVNLALFGATAGFTFTPTGVVLWLIVVLVLSALASVLPARNAARLTIREVLAYE